MLLTILEVCSSCPAPTGAANTMYLPWRPRPPLSSPEAALQAQAGSYKARGPLCTSTLRLRGQGRRSALAQQTHRGQAGKAGWRGWYVKLTFQSKGR